MYNPDVAENIILENLNGFYRAIVVDNKDELKSGRVKVRVIPFFDGVYISELPWAILADPNMGGLANNGSINVPEIGSHVFVFFENGDHRYPVYFAGAPAIQNGEPDVPKLSREDDGTVSNINSDTLKNIQTAEGIVFDEPDSAYNPTYPHNKVFKTVSGIIVEFDDTPSNERIHIKHPSGTRSEINAAGDAVEHVVGDKFSVVIGDDNICVKGGVNISVDGDVNLKATNVSIESSNIKLDSGNGIIGDVVTTNHTCAYTGSPHPQGSSTVKAGG